MNAPLDQHLVLTLSEAARFLRLKPARVKTLAASGQLPGRKIDEEWRFHKGALEQWLCGKPSARDILLAQAGALADDDTLPALLDSIYAARGRPETESED
jgi:excisionase family DNA binding protein